MGRKSKAELLESKQVKHIKPAKTLEARENQLISLAMDLAEQQLRDGTASSQIITEFVKRGSTKEVIEKEILAQQAELITAKTDAMRSAQTTEELYTKALEAMRSYTGTPVEVYED
jgi:hypothetical protein